MSEPPRVFLLSPARSGGARAVQLAHAASPLGLALRGDGAALGEVFAFLSNLYFRGKLEYASRFGASSLGVPGALVITPGHGLCRTSTPVRDSDLAAMARVDVSETNPAFTEPLLRDATRLVRSTPAETQVVLLGSIATPKYVAPLLRIFGERLLFPREFVGRGDMSRGGLLLRATRAGVELDYAPVHAAVLTGRRARRLSELS